MKNMFVQLSKDNFDSLYRNLCEDKGLMTVLAEMQVKQGIPERKAFENAGDMVRLVAERQNLEDLLSEDARKTLDLFLSKSGQMNGYDRKVLLHQMYFGMKLYQDPELVERLQSGTSREALFHEYYTRCGEDPAVTEEMLEKDIRSMISGYRISPKAMRCIAGRMARRRDLFATSAALGEKGLRFKCITAMDLYLRNKDNMTMEEAVNISGTNVQLEGVADALSCGQITCSRANMLLTVVCLASFLVGVAVLFSVPHSGASMDALVDNATMEKMGNIFSDPGYIRVTRGAEVGHETNMAIFEALKNTATRTQTVTGKVQGLRNTADMLMGVSLVTGLISEKAAALMGRLAAKHKFAQYDEAHTAAETLNDLADQMEAAAEYDAAAADNENRAQVLNDERETVTQVRQARAFA